MTYPPIIVGTVGAVVVVSLLTFALLTRTPVPEPAKADPAARFSPTVTPVKRP